MVCHFSISENVKVANHKEYTPLILQNCQLFLLVGFILYIYFSRCYHYKYTKKRFKIFNLLKKINIFYFSNFQ